MSISFTGMPSKMKYSKENYDNQIIQFRAVNNNIVKLFDWL